MSQELWWAFAVWGAACLWLAVAAILAARRSRLFRTVGGAVPFVTGTVPYALCAATRGLPAPWPRWPWSRWYR